MSSSFKNQLHEYFHLHHLPKEIYNSWRNFCDNILVLMILKEFNSANFLLKINTVMLHIVLMSQISYSISDETEAWC